MPTQTTDTVTQQVIEITSNFINIPKEQILPDSQFVADLGFDSLDEVEFAMLLEEILTSLCQMKKTIKSNRYGMRFKPYIN